MSWGAVGKSAVDSFKQGYQNRQQTRNQADPTGQGFGGGGTPAPAPLPTPQQVMPAADPMMVGAQAPAATAQQDSPMIALLHAIWQRPTAAPPAR